MVQFCWWLRTAIIISICTGLDSKRCKYYNLTEHMDCKNINLGEIKPDRYPVNIPSLKDLILHHTGLLRLEYNTFYNQLNLLTLDLSDNLLSVLDYRLFTQMPDLESLNLRNNRLVSLTDGRIFMNQRKLSSLILDFNRIKHLDETVLMPLESLRRLFMIANSFVCDCDLRKTVLWCESEGLETGGVCESPSEYTNSSWNILLTKGCNNTTDVTVSRIQMDDQICNYESSLELLNCTDVPLRKLTEHTFPKTLTLRILFLKNCGISKLERGVFDNFLNMDILDLSINFLEELDIQVFSLLHKLRKLILSDNKLFSLPADLFKAQKKLQILDLSTNHLTSLKLETFTDLESLQYLDLSGNGFVCDCELSEVMFWCQDRQISTGAKCEYPRKFSGHSWTILQNYTECLKSTTAVNTTEAAPMTDANPIDTLLLSLIVLALLFVFAIFSALWFYCRRKVKVDLIYDDVGNSNDPTFQNEANGEMKVLKNPLKLEKNEKMNMTCENVYEEVEFYRNRKIQCASYEIPNHLLGASKSSVLNNGSKNNHSINKKYNSNVPSYMEAGEECKSKNENLYV